MRSPYGQPKGFLTSTKTKLFLITAPDAVLWRKRRKPDSVMFADTTGILPANKFVTPDFSRVPEMWDFAGSALVRLPLPAQPVGATLARSLLAGVSKPKVFRGR